MGAAADPGWAEAVDGALARLVDVSGVDVAFGARVMPGGRTLVIDRLRGARTSALQGLVVRSGAGLGGKAMVLGRPVTVSDYVRAREISHQYDAPVSREGLRSMLAVPVVSAGKVTGVLYAGLRQRLEMGERMQRLAVGLAADVRRRLAEPAAPLSPPAFPGFPVDARLRDACRDLGAIIDRIDDPLLRADLEAVRHRLAAAPAPAPAPAAALSRREQEALGHAARGLATAEIAEAMGLSPGTVKAYLRSVLRKLGCRNRMEAVNAARGLGYPL
jgi:DNA-binding CsgD family transcriptional regulator